MKQTSFLFFKLLIAVMVIANPAGSQAGTATPIAEATTQIKNIQLMGQGYLTWWGLKVYHAQLWSATPAEQFNYTQHAHWLQLRYHRDFKGIHIAKRSREEIEKQGIGNPKILEAWQTQLAELFPNIQENDTLSALYLPGQPTQFFHNGKPIGQITDSDLSKAFMGIWLSPATSEPQLRSQLIGVH